MALEHLWASWRHSYVTEATAAERRGDDGSCVFCTIAATGAPTESNGIVWRDDLIFAVLNAYP